MRYKTLTLVLLYMLFIPMALDAATTIGVYAAQGHLLTESYPLLVLFGGMWGLVLTFGVAVANYFMITWYAERGEGECWLVISLVVWGLLLRAVAIYGNIWAMGHPVSYEIASTAGEYSTAAKVDYYQTAVLVYMLIPIGLQYLSYRLFKVRYKVQDVYRH